MYDYGARMYMPDIGRWGVVDPRSQYTHETYSYTWNNPIFFNDPTGMTGEAWSDWIFNPKTNNYRWDPNVTGPDNTPKGWKYIGPTGSYRIDGATVQLLEGGKTFTSIDEVAVSGTSPATVALLLSRNAQFGIFSLFAVASWYVIGDIVGTTYHPESVRIDPKMYRHTNNAESEATESSNAETDSTDVNGVKVPQEGNERTADNPLRRDKDGNAIPDDEAAGTEHTQLGTKQGRKGSYKQGREFDKNGNPVRDVDHTDHGRPGQHPNPHQHKWKPNKTGGTRQRGSAERL